MNAEPRPQEAFDQGEEPLPVPRVTQMSAMRLGPGPWRNRTKKGGKPWRGAKQAGWFILETPTNHG